MGSFNYSTDIKCYLDGKKCIETFSYNCISFLVGSLGPLYLLRVDDDDMKSVETLKESMLRYIRFYNLFSFVNLSREENENSFNEFCKKCYEEWHNDISYSFDWRTDKRALWRSACTHKNKNGSTFIDKGDIIECSICGAKIEKLQDITCDQKEEIEKEIDYLIEKIHKKFPELNDCTIRSALINAHIQKLK